MTTLQEAAQMALDALEYGLPVIEDFGAKEQLQIQHKAIAALYEALRAALAQPEQLLSGDPAPQQEPVAWRFWGYNEMNEKAWVYSDEWNPYYPRMKAQPLYTAPPQREWAGLTDDEVEEIDRWVDFKEEGSGRIPTAKLARYIEAKLKEKNR